MLNFNEILTFDSKNAYDFAYDLSMRKNFSTPKIYTANGDLKKRWYVYFSFRNPETGKLKRITPFYGDANKHKTKSDRMFVLLVYKHKIEELLKKGYNPFEDNTALFQKQHEDNHPKVATIEKQETAIKIEKPVTPEKIEKPIAPQIVAPTNQKTIKEAFEFALSLKKNVVNPRTYTEYDSKQKKLQAFIKKQYPQIIYIDQLTKNMVLQFLNSVLQRTSARSRNNYRLDLSSLMQILEDNEIIKSNMVRKISALKTTPERHKTYSSQTQEEIFTYLETKDPLLRLYILFISYNFLRPIEVNRLRIKDINIKEKYLQFKAKNKPFKKKTIPDILLNELPDLSNLNPDNYLFTPTKLGGVWESTEQNKRDYFSKRFKKVVKDHFDLGIDYGLYSFRHFFISKSYRELEKKYAPFEAKSRLMRITGHASMTALEKYLRDIDAELAEDYSELLKTT